MFHRGLLIAWLVTILTFAAWEQIQPVTGANAVPLGAGNETLSDTTYYNPYPIVRCPGIGTAAAEASTHGIRFSAKEIFFGIALRMVNYDGGPSTFTAELRRSDGFTGDPDYTVDIDQNFPPTGEFVFPYEPVFLDFGLVGVTGTEIFTLKFTNINQESELYFESFGTTSLAYCPTVSVTNENNVSVPTIRGDPAGFKVLAQGSSHPSYNSVYQSAPPLIDGVMSPGEWPNRRINFSDGFITITNDNSRLYLLVDLLDATGNGASDSLGLTFDVDRNGGFTPGVDRQYSSSAGGNLNYRTYVSTDGQRGPLEPAPYSARARGYGCFKDDGTLDPPPSPAYCVKHRVWEVAIDLSEIEAEDFYSKVSTRLGFYGFTESPSSEFEFPNEPRQFNDLANLIEVYFDIGPGYEYSSDPGATVSLNNNAVEITQAIQNRQNTLPLAGRKETVARAYVNVTGTTYNQPVRVYLFGRKGGVDLPGSPLMMLYFAPPNAHRETLNHTANFLLPASWREDGTVTFWSKIRDFQGGAGESTQFPVKFWHQDAPTYWVVPINTWTAASPTLVDNAEILSQQQATIQAFPVWTINFVRKGWREVGATTVTGTIDALNEYYRNSLEAWNRSVRDSGTEPFTFPDQIYGFTPSGGGLSDPPWFSGNGRVARGFRGTSLELTMAHEIDHNLDRSASGTWGRHVEGCTASGSDPDWPYDNDDIQEVGFDTHKPWVDTAARDTVVPANFPDFMSYCQSDDLSGISPGHLPTKWISPYRWQSLFDHFTNTTADPLPDLQAAIEDVLYISGVIHQNGAGELAPLYSGPGVPSTDIAPGNYTLEILDLANTLLDSMSFMASFVDVEGNPRSSDSFFFQLGSPGGAAKVRLKHDDTILDTITASANPPTVTVTAPDGGENWSALQTITWTAADTDGDDLTFRIQYTPDNGQTWYPVAAGIQQNYFEVDFSNLPGSDQARILVIAGDGFHSAEDTSNGTFATGDNPPVVSITKPLPADNLPASAPIFLSGKAIDLEDGDIPDDSLVWIVDGEGMGFGLELQAWLEPGVHEVTLAAMDGQGNEGQQTVAFYVGSGIYLPMAIR